MSSGMDIVTGAFGYIGRYITTQLLQEGRSVKTITTHVGKPNPFEGQVISHPYNFDKPDLLKETLRGAETLYNTYWVRFNHGSSTFSQAVKNTEVLFECAASVGVQKIVQISVTNANEDSYLPYYQGKALQEVALKRCKVPYTIIRPTLVFGKEDILVNNIAWLIRKFRFFPIFGDGRFRLQPIYVEDLASIAIAGAGHPGNLTLDAIGPEHYTFEQFVRLIADVLERKVIFLKTPPSFGILLGKLIGFALRDVILTRSELDGLMLNMLTSQQPPNGETRFSDWLERNQLTIGSSYSSELERHFRWKTS